MHNVDCVLTSDREAIPLLTDHQLLPLRGRHGRLRRGRAGASRGNVVNRCRGRRNVFPLHLRRLRGLGEEGLGLNVETIVNGAGVHGRVLEVGVLAEAEEEDETDEQDGDNAGDDDTDDHAGGERVAFILALLFTEFVVVISPCSIIEIVFIETFLIFLGILVIPAPFRCLSTIGILNSYFVLQVAVPDRLLVRIIVESSALQSSSKAQTLLKAKHNKTILIISVHLLCLNFEFEFVKQLNLIQQMHH